jgi:hypothetical protein
MAFFPLSRSRSSVAFTARVQTFDETYGPVFSPVITREQTPPLSHVLEAIC